MNEKKPYDRFSVGSKYRVINWGLFPKINGDISTYLGYQEGYHVFKLSQSYESGDVDELDKIYVQPHLLGTSAVLEPFSKSEEKIAENYDI